MFHHFSSPANKEELFNLRHSQLRNVIERIFGVIKKEFAMASQACNYPMRTQAQIIPALCLLRNFILVHDPDDFNESDITSMALVNGSQANQNGEVFIGTGVSRAESTRAAAYRDTIATDMWASYQEECSRRTQTSE